MPTMRTYRIARESKTEAPIEFIVNGYYPYGVLDRQLVEYMQGEGMSVAAKIPRTVALARAASNGVSVAEFDAKNPAVSSFAARF